VVAKRQRKWRAGWPDVAWQNRPRGSRKCPKVYLGQPIFRQIWSLSCEKVA
jgi:hypothetical protein